LDEDLAILWKQAGPFAIQVNEHGLAWRAGAVRDVFALDADRVIVATDTGGVRETRSVGFARAAP